MSYKGVQSGDDVRTEGVGDVVQDGGRVVVVGLAFGLGLCVGTGDVVLWRSKMSVMLKRKVHRLDSAITLCPRGWEKMVHV